MTPEQLARLQQFYSEDDVGYPDPETPPDQSVISCVVGFFMLVAVGLFFFVVL